MVKVIKYMKNHKIYTIIFLLSLILFSTIFKIYLFNYKYKTTGNTSIFEVIVEELNSFNEDKVSYIVRYKR